MITFIFVLTHFPVLSKAARSSFTLAETSLFGAMLMYFSCWQLPGSKCNASPFSHGPAPGRVAELRDPLVESGVPWHWGTWARPAPALGFCRDMSCGAGRSRAAQVLLCRVADPQSPRSGGLGTGRCSRPAQGAAAAPGGTEQQRPARAEGDGRSGWSSARFGQETGNPRVSLLASCPARESRRGWAAGGVSAARH